MYHLTATHTHTQVIVAKQIQEPRQERKRPPRQLTLWVVLTFKGVVLYFLYIHCVFFVCFVFNILYVCSAVKIWIWHTLF